MVEWVERARQLPVNRPKLLALVAFVVAVTLGANLGASWDWVGTEVTHEDWSQKAYDWVDKYAAAGWIPSGEFKMWLALFIFAFLVGLTMIILP